MSLGDQLRRAIAAAEKEGITGYRIAKDTGLDFGVFYRFANGDRDIRLSTAERLADYLGLELRPKPRSKRKRRRV